MISGLFRYAPGKGVSTAQFHRTAVPDYPPVYGPGKAFFFVGKGDPDQVKAFLQRYGGAETTAGHRDRLVVYAHFVYILIYTAADFDGCPVGMDDLVRQVKFVINKLAQGHKKLPGGPAALGSSAVMTTRFSSQGTSPKWPSLTEK